MKIPTKRLPHDMSPQKGKHVQFVQRNDASLFNNKLLGRPVNVCIHFLNVTILVLIKRGKLQIR